MLMTRCQCLLVGEAPNRAGRSTELHTKLAARVRDEVVMFNRSAKGYRAGLSIGDPMLWEWLRRTRHVNLLDWYPGPKFPHEDGSEAAAALWAAVSVVHPGRCSVVLAGRAVARSFGCDLPPLTWGVRDGIRIAVVPHPSGLNRFWNEKNNRERALFFLRAEGARLMRSAEMLQDALD